MFNITTVVFALTSPPFIVQTLQDGTAQVQNRDVPPKNTTFPFRLYVISPR